MNAPDGELIYGWKSIAEAAGCSQRHVRDLVAERQIDTTRRADGAVGVRRVDLLPIAQELARSHEAAGGVAAAHCNLGEGEVPAVSPPALRVVPLGLDISHAEPEPKHAVAAVHDDDGAIAALVFADLTAGKTLVQIVTERRLVPEIVLSHHERWRQLRDLDQTAEPTALERLAQVEATTSQQAKRLEEAGTDLQSLSGQLAAVETKFSAWCTQLTEMGRRIEGRLRVLDGRVNPGRGADTSDTSRRLTALESQVRNLPAAALLLPERRCGCGGPLAVLACCSTCGAGRAAS